MESSPIGMCPPEIMEMFVQRLNEDDGREERQSIKSLGQSCKTTCANATASAFETVPLVLTPEGLEGLKKLSENILM